MPLAGVAVCEIYEFRQSAAAWLWGCVRIAIPSNCKENLFMTRFFRKLSFFVLLLPVLQILLCSSDLAAADPLMADLPERLLANLGARDFAVRSEASARLKKLSVNELLKLSEELPDQPNAEVVVRIQAEIESRYASQDPASVQAASRLLEAQAHDQRLMVADVAQQSLRRHWKQRIEIAIRDLEQHGAIVRRGAFATSSRFNPFPGSGSYNNAIRILLTEAWTGGDADIDVFERLAALCGPVTGESGVKLFLLAGNPLTEEQEKRLTDLIGQNRVAKRSRVALGISPSFTNAQGVLIGQVTPGSSAAEAKLRAGDLIVAIEPKFTEPVSEDKEVPQIIPAETEDKTLVRDFDDLVERLMDYREGDIMTVRIRRDIGYFGGRLNPDDVPDRGLETVKVKMKGWQDLVPE